MEGAVLKAVLPLIKTIFNEILNTNRLKDGDVTTQWFRERLMDKVSKIDDKLDHQNQTCIKEGKELFEVGVRIMPDGDEKRILGCLLQKHRLNFKKRSERRGNSSNKAGENVVDGRVMFHDRKKAKEIWKDCKERARNAFNNGGLKLHHRIKAAKLKILATILEDVQNPLPQLEDCKVTLENLNKDPQVINNVQVQIARDSHFEKLRRLPHRKKRKELILSVADVNRMVWTHAHRLGTDYPDAIKFYTSDWPEFKFKNGTSIHPVLNGGIRQIFVKASSGDDCDEHVWKCDADTCVEFPPFLQGYTCTQKDGSTIIFESSSRKDSYKSPQQAWVSIFDERGKQMKTFGKDVFTKKSILTSMAVNEHGQLLIVDDHTHRLHAFDMHGNHIGKRASWEPHEGYSYIATAPNNRLFKTHGNRSVRIYDLNQTPGIYHEQPLEHADWVFEKDSQELNGIAYDSCRQKLYVLVKGKTKKSTIYKSKLQMYSVDIPNITFESDIKLPEDYADSKGIALTPAGLVAIGNSENNELIIV